MSKTQNAAYYREYRARLRETRTEVEKPPYRKKNKGRQKGLWERGNFIAWDGEGITREDGVHMYVLLANSLGHSIANPNGLSTDECFDFIMAERQKHAINVWFSFDYDVNMMLGAIDDIETLRELYTDGLASTRITKRYSFHYVPRHTFRIERHGEKLEKVTHWDSWGFFQGSFIKAMRDYLGENYPTYEMIRSNKERRSQFTLDDFEEIKRYCFAELEALQKMMEILHDAINTATMPRLQRYDGAGAIGTAVLRSNGVKHSMATFDKHEAKYLARYAYFGGRNEICAVGRCERTIHHYDINSAYPAAMRELPCLAHGRWKHHDRNSWPASAFSLIHVKWEFRDNGLPFYPLPLRRYDNQILFPPSGEGWYWKPEVLAAFAYTNDEIDVLESWEFEQLCVCPAPFAFVEEYYVQRQKLKEQGNMAQFALKLGLNSLYGKMAQQVGRPAYHQLEWAGFVTSSSRAKLLQAGSQSPQSILQFATDGIFSTEPLDLPCSKKIGEWEYQQHDGAILAQSGVYWLQEGEKYTGFRRGFGVNAIDHERVLRAWEDGLPSVATEITRFVSGRAVAAGISSFADWRRWVDDTRVLEIRATGKRYHDGGQFRPDIGLVRTYAEHAYGAMSVPYPENTRYEDIIEEDSSAD